MRVVQAKVATLRVSDENPRKISKARLEQLKRSLSADPEMLKARPLIALKDGTVVAGNQRLVAAQALGWKTIPTVYADLDRERARLWMLRDNQEYGAWEEEGLQALLRELESGGADLDLTGFASEEIDRLLTAISTNGNDPDDTPPLPKGKPRSKPGEVYELGPHRLMCGDCTQAFDVYALVKGTAVDLILTDPPYCSGGFQEAGRAQGSVGTDAPHKQIANDRLSTRGYIALLKSALSGVPAAYAYVFTDWRMWVYLFDIVESSGFGVRSMIVWDKGSPGMGRGWRSQHELVMWGAKATPPFDKHASGQGNVIGSQRTGNVLHTTQKPVDLLTELLAVVPFAESVYDPFAGSGSTLIACEQLGRRCLAMELDPGYCDVIRARYEAFVSG